MKECLKDLFDLTVSTGSISNAEQTVSQSLEVPAGEVYEALKAATVAHADETTHYRRHRLEWLWVITNKKFAYFSIQKRRTQAVAKWLFGSCLEDKQRITDRYSAYHFIPDENHQYCWAHLKRDIQSICDSSDPAQVRVGQRLEASRYALFHQERLLSKATEAERPAYRKSLLNHIEQFRYALREGCQLTGTKTAGFCRNLMRHWRCLWVFLRHPEVPATNNHGEQIIRHNVLWRKVSHGSQSESG